MNWNKNNEFDRTVAGRSLQSSYWPDILFTDASRTKGVRKPIWLSTTIASLVALLCAIAGVITPLGLYDAMEPSSWRVLPFTYIKDTTPFGAATPSRSTFAFSRTCSQGHGLAFQGPAPCPYSGTIVVYSWNGTTFSYEMPYGYNTTIPDILRDIFSSGTSRSKGTISNYFDIEWRSYSFQQDKLKNNGSTLLVGEYRPVTSIIFEETPQIVEGLIVDTKSGGIGFRNHTIPTGLKHGASWAEELLFVGPDTQCVNTNLSIEFTVTSGNDSRKYDNFFLVDEGGFHALNTRYPVYDHENAQNNPDIRARAYKAAWLNNVWSMAFFNVTNVNDEDTGDTAFRYIDSFPGKKFALGSGSYTNYASQFLSRTFGYYIPRNDGIRNYSNPFNVTAADFDAIRKCICIDNEFPAHSFF